MFESFARLLRPGGILMFTSGSDHGETWSENMGSLCFNMRQTMRPAVAPPYGSQHYRPGEHA
jgi:hypothetical protein